MYIVDRIEGNKVVLECENGEDKIIDIKLLPSDIRESDVIDFIEGRYVINIEETTKRKNNIKKKFNNLFNN